MDNPKIAVLIDAENISPNSIQEVLEGLSKTGRIIVNRAYADWSAAKSMREQVLALNIEPIHIFKPTKSRKNACDIRLVIDALDLMYSSSVDTFVIVSSDSDFLPLVRRLRAAGKTVLGVGRKAVLSDSYVVACDKFIYLDQNKQHYSTKADNSNLSEASQSADAVLVEIDDAWSKRAKSSGESIPGPTAAIDAAKAYRVAKLRDSPRKTLQRLLDSSSRLSEKWARNANAIIRR